MGTLNNGTNQLFETTTACSLNCEVRFPLVSPEDSYIIEVSPLNRQGERVGDSVVTNFSKLNFITISYIYYEVTHLNLVGWKVV